MNPPSLRGSPNSAAFSAALSRADCAGFLPIMPPTTGMNTSAMNSDAVSVRITVMGRNFMNSPTVPDQNSSGKNTDRVVAVDAMIGQDMRFAAWR